MLLPRLVILWLLMFSFAAQPLLNYLAMPFFLETEEGIKVVICTLEGERELTLDLAEHAETLGNSLCSALQLQHMLGSLQIPVCLLPVTVVLRHVLEPRAGPSNSLSGTFAAFSARAPPLA